MAKVPNNVETLPKISIAWVGCTNVTDYRQTDDRQTTDRRQTDGRRHIANMNISSRSLKITCSEMHPSGEDKPLGGSASKTIQFTVRVKKSSHPLKLFAIFSLRLSIFPWNFACLLPVHIHTSTNFGWFILIFNIMALIFLRVLIIFTVSSFEFQQVRLPRFHRL